METPANQVGRLSSSGGRTSPADKEINGTCQHLSFPANSLLYGSGRKMSRRNRRAVAMADNAEMHEPAVTKKLGRCRHRHRSLSSHRSTICTVLNIFSQMARLERSAGCRSIGWLLTEGGGRSDLSARRETSAVGTQKVVFDENQIAVNTIHVSFKDGQGHGGKRAEQRVHTGATVRGAKALRP